MSSPKPTHTQCWDEDPKSRPTFADLARNLSVLFEDVEPAKRRDTIGSRYTALVVDDELPEYTKSPNIPEYVHVDDDDDEKR